MVLILLITLKFKTDDCLWTGMPEVNLTHEVIPQTSGCSDQHTAASWSCQIPLQGTWGLSWIRPGNSRDRVPTTRITEFQSWKGIQDLAGRQQRQQARERRTSRWSGREAKEGAADPEREWRNTDAMLESLCKVYRHTFPTLLLKLFCVFDIERGKLQRVPSGALSSRCFPSPGLLVSPAGCLLTRMGIKTFCEQ